MFFKKPRGSDSAPIYELHATLLSKMTSMTDVYSASHAFSLLVKRDRRQHHRNKRHRKRDGDKFRPQVSLELE